MIFFLIVLFLEVWDLWWLFISVRNVFRLLKLYVLWLFCGYLVRFWVILLVFFVVFNIWGYIFCCGFELKCKIFVFCLICSLWMRFVILMFRFMLVCNVLVFVVIWLVFKVFSIVRIVRLVMVIKFIIIMVVIWVFFLVWVIFFGVDILFFSFKFRIGFICFVFFMVVDNLWKKVLV